MESVAGSKQAIIHIYNSTSPAQRRDVFGLDKAAIKQIAVDGVRIIKDLLPTMGDTRIRLEYSPESFSQTEPAFALEVCEAVVDVWEPSAQDPVILNLPATVESSSPNIYADQIEWFCRNLRDRKSAVVSLHTHNDRGTGVAATELGILAGADRVEGTLFGNGERTGNLDVVTVALNMHTQGVDPELDFHDLNEIRRVYEKTVRMPVHPRHPWAGELVYTAFSGSHQDAIRKGMAARDKEERPLWEVPYLPVNPHDVGREYEPVIRINSQSGKGGAAFIMENDHGYHLPRAMHADFAKLIQGIAERTGDEVPPEEIMGAFRAHYLDMAGPFALQSFRSTSGNDNGEGPADRVSCEISLLHDGKSIVLNGTGNGPLDACRHALTDAGMATFRLMDYHQHSKGRGSDATAVAYIALEIDGKTVWGAGEDEHIARAGVRAILAGLNRGLAGDRKSTEATSAKQG
jgi:2-isopropylmalate synthase